MMRAMVAAVNSSFFVIMCVLQQVRKVQFNQHLQKLKVFKRLSEVLEIR